MSIKQEAISVALSRWKDEGDPWVTNMGEADAFVAGYIAGATRPVTDAEADAAQIAFHEYVVGADEPLTERDLRMGRQAWKVALEAACALADKETP